MRFLKYLQEEYEMGISTGFSRSTEVFNFPDKKELKGLTDVRFIIDIDQKKFYVWDGNSPLIHAYAFSSLNISKRGVIMGLGSYNSSTGKINISKKLSFNTSSSDTNKIYTIYGNLGNIGGKLRKQNDFLNNILRYFDDATKAYFLNKLRIQ